MHVHMIFGLSIVAGKDIRRLRSSTSRLQAVRQSLRLPFTVDKAGHSNWNSVAFKGAPIIGDAPLGVFQTSRAAILVTSASLSDAMSRAMLEQASEQ